MSTLVITLPLGSPQAPADYSYTLTVDGHNATQQASASAALLRPHASISCCCANASCARARRTRS